VPFVAPVIKNLTDLFVIITSVQVEMASVAVLYIRWNESLRF
jgi:hypothetical protein